MSRLAAALVAALLGLTALTGAGSAAGFRADPEPRAHVGSGSGGDPYFPADGNGGGHTGHYPNARTHRHRSGPLAGPTGPPAGAPHNPPGVTLCPSVLP